MSPMQGGSSQASQHASSSSNPLGSSEIRSSPAPLPPNHRRDINAIKQELQDVLGDQGLPYWTALGDYLEYRLRHDEFLGMVKKWLGRDVQLHNQLIAALLSNAATPSLSAQSPALSNMRKRRRLGHDDPDFDTDETRIEPKARVHTWVMGLTGKERMRVRRAVIGREEEADGEDGEDGEGKKRKLSAFAPTTTMPPIALSEGALPSSHQLSLRLSQLAKAYDLTLAPDATTEIGEFLAVGMNSHLGDVVNTLVRVTGKNRRGVDTIHVPTSHFKGLNENGHYDHFTDDRDIKQPDECSMPKPDLETMQSLFHLAPELHTQASPALYKLHTSQMKSSHEVKVESSPPPEPILRQVRANVIPTKKKPSPKSSTRQGMHPKSEATRERLLRNDLFKLEPGRQEGEGKKDRKHNLHWKYEDPAVIFQDLLG